MNFMESYWKHAFMPFPPRALIELRWFRERAFLFFEMPGGFSLPGLALFVFLAGVLAIGFRKRQHAAYLFLPIGFALIASGLKLYPFHARATLYLAPIIMLAIGEGIRFIAVTRDRCAGMAAAALLLVLLGAQPLVRATRTLVAPTRHHELDRAVAYVDAHWQPGDRVFMPRIDQFSYRFIAGRYTLPEEALVFQPQTPEDKAIGVPMDAELREIASAGGTVWFPMTYEHEYTIQPILDILDQLGSRTEDVDFRGASAYRYEFPRQPEPTG